MRRGDRQGLDFSGVKRIGACEGGYRRRDWPRRRYDLAVGADAPEGAATVLLDFLDHGRRYAAPTEVG
jgi:hypothetical protein